MTLNLDNPIFIVNVGIGSLPRLRAEESIAQVIEMFKYDNATFWILPDKSSECIKIELIWKGNKFEVPGVSNESVSKLHEKLNKVVNLLSEGTSDISIKRGLRDLMIDEII